MLSGCIRSGRGGIKAGQKNVLHLGDEITRGGGTFPTSLRDGLGPGLREGGQTAGPSTAVVRAANDLRSA